MATNPLMDDLGVTPNQDVAPVKTNPLFADLGVKAQSNTKTPTQTSQVKPESSSTVGDILKAVPRQLITGTSRLLDTVGSGIESMLPHQTQEEQGIPQDIDHPVYQAIAKEAADRLGLPKTNTNSRLARIVGAGVEAAPSAALFGPEAIAPTMLSGAASQGAAEAGAGPTGQFLAGMVAPMGPSIAQAGARGLIRGGSEGAANMQANIANANNAGIAISAGQAANSPILRRLETVGSYGPGGGPLANTRRGINSQVEASIDDITSKITGNTTPPTAATGGQAAKTGIQAKVTSLNDEISDARQAFHKEVPKDSTLAAPNLEKTVQNVTTQTGDPEVDKLLTGAKTRGIAKAVQSKQEPPIPTSYNVDEGYHTVTSPNGESHAIEDAQGNLRVYRDDTLPEAQGKGEGSARLDTLARIATSQGKTLVSDFSVSPNEAKTFEGLARKGWQVDKNPNAVTAATGNTISDSPKNPVYTVKAPQTTTTPAVVNPKNPNTPGTSFSYNTKTGQSTPGPVQTPQPIDTPSQTNPVLKPTPWSVDELMKIRTVTGRAIGATRDAGQAGQLKQIYGAVNDDLNNHIATKGQQAQDAWDMYNTTAKNNIAQQKVLMKVVGKNFSSDPGQVFKAALRGTKDDAGKLSQVMGAMDDNGQNQFRASVLYKLGRKSGAPDQTFDADRFFNGWKNMSPEAKDALFNTKSGWGSPGQLRSGLDSLSDTLDLLKKQGYLKPVNKLEQATGHGGVWGGTIALLGEKVLEAGGHIVAGNHLAAAGVAGTALAASAINPIMSRVLTNPRTVSWLAQATKAPTGAMPALTAQLTKMSQNDPDARDLNDLISQGHQ
jgi:hypothetical protein